MAQAYRVARRPGGPPQRTCRMLWRGAGRSGPPTWGAVESHRRPPLRTLSVHSTAIAGRGATWHGRGLEAMCLVGPCADGAHHDSDSASEGAEPARLPPRAADAGPPARPRRSPRRRAPGRRTILGGPATLAATACIPGPSQAAPMHQEEVPPEPAPTEAPPPPAPTAVPPTPTPAPTAVPAPEPRLTRLGGQGIVQPFFQADGGRVLFYDQPAPGQGGTWSIDPASAAAQLVRPHWGYYLARGTLAVAPRPNRRDTYVVHIPTGREWTLPTTNGAVFSGDGTVVAY